MIEVNGVIYRNLEEQVQKNKEDIENLQNQQSGDDTDIELINNRLTEVEENLTDITPDVMRALKTPIATPNQLKIVAVDTTNSQEMLNVGTGLVVEDNTLKLSGGTGGGSNPNLLINGDFRVNQRGLSLYEYTTSSQFYTVDRWKAYATGSLNSKLTPTSNGIKITSDVDGTNLYQMIEMDWERLLNKTVTASAKINGTIYSVTGTLPSSIPTINNTNYRTLTTDSFVLRIEIRISASIPYLATGIWCKAGELNVEYIKLEFGSIATAFSSRPYAEELTLCQRYFQRINYDSIRTMYCGANNSLYCKSLSSNLLRTPPTITTFTTAQVRNAYGGNSLTNATSLELTYYVTNGVGGNTIRFKAIHETEITPQDTNLFIQNVELDAEIY